MKTTFAFEFILRLSVIYFYDGKPRVFPGLQTLKEKSWLANGQHYTSLAYNIHVFFNSDNVGLHP